MPSSGGTGRIAAPQKRRAQPRHPPGIPGLPNATTNVSSVPFPPQATSTFLGGVVEDSALLSFTQMPQASISSAPPSSDLGTDRLLLSFRTLTTMVDTFARAGYSSKQERKERPPQDEKASDIQHSRVLRALATLLVRNTEIVAVTVVDWNGAGMQLLALGEKGSQAGSTPASMPIDPERLGEDGDGSGDAESKLPLSVSWFAVANPRRPAPATEGLTANAHEGNTVKDTLLHPSENLLPYIWNSRPSLPPGKVPGSGERNSIYFDRFSEERIQPLSHHADMLRGLIFPVFREGPLYRYVVGKCFPKMLRRKDHPITQHLIASLKITINPSEIFSAGNIKLQTADRHCISTLRRLCDKIDNQSTEVLQKLLKLLDSIEAETGGAPALYSETTCLHFHAALIALLTGFSASLDALFATMRNPIVPLPEAAVRTQIAQVQLWGLALQAMVYSEALPVHLQAIDPLLIHPSRAADSGRNGGNEGGGCNEGDDGDDSELQATSDEQVHPRASMAFLAGLRLTVSYFKSIHIIKTFLAKHKLENLTIDTVCVPHEGSEMLPWKVSLRQWLPEVADAPGVLSVAAVAQAVEILNEREQSKAVRAGFLKLTVGKDFSGTLHCEACMATFMHLARAKSPVLAQLGDGLGALMHASVIGVSKRCCPICDRLLALLRQESLADLGMLPSHRTFTPCALPKWLPKKIIVDMVEYVWGVLMEMLAAAVKDTAENGRVRAISTHSCDSDYFSSDSEGGPIIYSPEDELEDQHLLARI